ncbi:MAG TPA: PKD domain-containing protein, partial [Actinospica sp.]|nr:PKD domain-containing protein [Actinospica sp.]
MARKRLRRALTGAAAVAATTGVGLAALFGPGIGPAAAQARTAGGTPPTPARIRPLTVSDGADVSALDHAYAAARHLSPAALGGMRAGSVHAAEDTATGERWAVADFVPSATATPEESVSFQDGASRALFTSASGETWRLRETLGQAAGCAAADALPAAVFSALSLAAPRYGAGSCDAGDAPPPASQLAALARQDSIGSSIASVALGQVGVATNPAETSFKGADCNPFSTLVGAASPNSNGCGTDSTHNVADENEEWCADFAKWVWEQAGVTVGLNTLNAGANSFYAWARAQGGNPAADSGTPQVGDAVVFYPAGTISSGSFADHVGLISSVNADGTVSMVNGDFLGSNGITVQYNQNLALTSWAGTNWGSGEQWVLIPPPAAAQPPAPTASITAPSTAAAGTAVPFTASATEPGGSITGYAWTFGDGRDTDATGASVSHVFSRAGFYTVTMSATSNLGTVTTKTWNIGVSAPSGGVSAAPSNSVWYSPYPVMQYAFAETSAGALAVDSWDGAAWLRQAEPGTLAAGSGLTGLSYPDPAVADATVPHAFYRTRAGALGESHPAGSGWVGATLAGSPAATSAVAAIAVDRAANGEPAPTVTPSVFYFDSASALEVSSPQGSTWSAATIQGPSTAAPRSLAVATSGSAEYVFYLDNAGHMIAATNVGGAWQSAPVPNGLGITAGTALSAAATASGIDVFFVDAAGRLAAATHSGSGSWTTREIAGTPSPGTVLLATDTLTSSGAAVDEVYYLNSCCTAGVTWWNGSAWQSGTLPGRTSAIDAVSGNAVPGSAQQVFLSDGSALSVDTDSAPGAAWSSTALPSTPTAYPGTVLLYAASSADDAAALSAASSAGLAASQVSTSFATAWAAVLSGNYLVITVGQAAADALYQNPCGWTNPSRSDPGSTPFSYVTKPVNTTLTNLFLVGAAAAASNSTQRADDLAYFAVHGALPEGAPDMPAAARPS